MLAKEIHTQIEAYSATVSPWHAGLVAFTVYLILRTIYLVTLHPLASVPGPWLARISDVWKARETAKGRYVTSLRRAHEKWGRIVRIGPNEVSVVAPEDLKQMYGHGTRWTKGPFYPAWSIGERGHFSHTDPHLHGLGRRAVAAAYSTNNLLGLEDINNPAKLFGYFERAALSNSVADLTQLVEWFAYDTAFSIPVRGILPVLADGTAFLVLTSCFSDWSWIVPTAPFHMLLQTLLGDKGPVLFVKFSTALVNERLRLRENDPEAFADKTDMLSHLLKAVDRQPSNSSPRIGSAPLWWADTTNTSMCAFLGYVYDPQNATTLQKLRDEVAQAIDEGKLSFPVPYAQGANLEFMQACIKEANRMHPAVGMTLQRVVPQGGAHVHYDERAYGKDAHLWRPERWLEEEAKSDLSKYNLAFGQGSRICLGKNISILEMLKLLPSLVWHWDLIFEDYEKPFTVNESWFTVPSELKCRLRKRDV
ncbi:hypothetical protein OIV83_002719 [Microbotryomycetes sp. JL201]|nr:hypothetical protein OIV83_002719 [Microbotryomycetes sp. JL201]